MRRQPGRRKESPVDSFYWPSAYDPELFVWRRSHHDLDKGDCCLVAKAQLLRCPERAVFVVEYAAIEAVQVVGLLHARIEGHPEQCSLESLLHLYTC